jgi:hypothetical protein
VTKEKKERLFHLIEGEAEDRFAISALLIMAFGVLARRFSRDYRRSLHIFN